ncbi:MAG TPA: acyl-CoA dehydrogenase family protein [Thermoleophilaceae bacterium]|jgi:alkylation response protein AidB-like acyl-CoA dehydrogenase|nr:acyl-CoA dehydrogenase family protein [Thermoleophilaceae bacterium]
MNFDFTDDQRAIKETARDLLAKRFKLERLRELAESKTYADDAWNEVSELGWPGIFIAEEHGGQGLGVIELVILLEELGYVLAPLPFLSNAAAGLILQDAGATDRLAGVASGEQRGTVGVVKDGRAALVPDAEDADFIVLLDGTEATLVERGDAEVEAIDAIDPTRRYAAVTANGGESLGDVSRGRDLIALATAAELVGISQRVMEMAIEYAKDRKQFDRPIGAYQAVSHACADMLKQVEGSRSLVYYAGWAADAAPDEFSLAASMAKAYASDAGWQVSASALQVHGGIGFTWEHDLHWFLKRAKTDGVLYGSARDHRERVAELAGLGAATAAV